MDKNVEFYRFKIIEPFLKKEKKLKEIEKEKNISYATLKRWVSAYKKNGVIGLEKKTREDKNSFRNIDNSELKEIKKICNETSETNITKLYRYYKKKIADDLSISYATFYRIVNNIDHFFNKDTVRYLKNIKKEHQCYLVLELPLYILIKDTEVPHLLLMADAATLEPLNFYIRNSQSNFYELLSFIREGILKVSIKNEKLITPKEILVESKEINNKQILRKIFQMTNIKISEHFTENSEIKKLKEFISKDIQALYDQQKIKNYTDLFDFLISYLYLQKKEFAFCINYTLVDTLEYIRKLDGFLQKTSRKVNDSKVRVKNIIYTSDNLKNFNGESVDILFSPVVIKYIYIFSKEKYLFRGKKI